MAEIIDCSFKAAIQIKQGESIAIPSIGQMLPIQKFNVWGGDKRFFSTGQSISNGMELGSEIEQMKRLKNIQIVRQTDLYSIDFYDAKLKNRMLSIAFSFRVLTGDSSRITTQVLALAYIKEFKHSVVNGERTESILLHLQDVEITYQPVIVTKQKNVDLFASRL